MWKSLRVFSLRVSPALRLISAQVSNKANREVHRTQTIQLMAFLLRVRCGSAGGSGS